MLDSKSSGPHETTLNLPDWFLESVAGQLLYYTTRSKIAWYAEEQPDYEIPEKYTRTKGLPSEKQDSAIPGGRLQPTPAERPSLNRARNSEDTVVPTPPISTRDLEQQPLDAALSRLQHEVIAENPEAQKTVPKVDDPNLVTWYGPKDPANPQNWSSWKKNLVTAELCLLTFSIYIGSAIYSPGYESLYETFGVSHVEATLGLSLFVMGYGIGPLFLAPLSEIPSIGRTPPYVVTLALFVILQPISATVQNFGGLLALRFLAGFVGSPVLATGAASLGDMYSHKTRPYAVGIWVMAAVCGPTLGPLLGGFAIQAHDWRWAFWVLLWLDGFCLLTLIFCFPETSSDTILLRRAQRLRKHTGNENLRAATELEVISVRQVILNTLVLPIWLSVAEPMCLATNLYVGLLYSILYIWIESFGLVYSNIYGFNLGETGLAFMGLFVGALLAYIGYCLYNRYYEIPQYRRHNGLLPPELRLPIAMFGSILLPIGIIGFGALARRDIHWMAPTVFTVIYSAGDFLTFLGAVNYLQDAYPRRAASILAGNDFFRSMMGACFPLFAHAMFNNLAVSWGPVFFGSLLLGCLCILFIPLPFLLFKYGRTLRMHSKQARHDI